MQQASAISGIDRPATIFSLIFTGTLGTAAFLVLPSIVIGMVTDLHFSSDQAGGVSGFQLLGLAAGSVANLWLIRRWSWRRIAGIGIAVLMVADASTLVLETYRSFACARFIAGLGGGLAISLAAYALGHTASSDRNFGWFLTFQVSFAIVGMLVFPLLIDAFGIDGVFFSFVGIEAAVLLRLVPRIPEVRAGESGATGTNDPRRWLFCFAVLTAIICFFVALGGFWSYIAPIGIEAGLSKQATGRALSIGLAGGLAGAYVAASVNVRFGRLLPITLAVGSQLAALALLLSGFGFAAFVLAACLFCFGWYMLFPYQLGLLAAVDRDGRPMLLSNALAGLGSGLGPLFVANFPGEGFIPAYVICIVFLSLSLAIMVAVVLLGRRQMQAAHV